VIIQFEKYMNLPISKIRIKIFSSYMDYLYIFLYLLIQPFLNGRTVITKSGSSSYDYFFYFFSDFFKGANDFPPIYKVLLLEKMLFDPLTFLF
jgi:hypothetical protein